jgi:peptide/nickel transport system substrate-binding protein
LRTAAPYPLLLQDISLIRIASAKSLGASDASKNAADAPLAGTGRYRIARRNGEAVELRPHLQYWGTRAAWDTVTLRPLPIDSERVDALLADRVNAIERIPPQMIDRLRADKHVTVYQAVSGRLMYLQLGTHRVNPPELSYSGQTSSAPSPLLDRRVRRAISEAIDRRELVGSVLHGLGEPAGQLVPRGYSGHAADVHGDARDVADARALLAESGLPNGFVLTIHGPINVYPRTLTCSQRLRACFAMSVFRPTR